MSNADVRKVRAPRFSDAEWSKLTKQAERLLSPRSDVVTRRRMSAHEFVREASMAVVRILEEWPHGHKPPGLFLLLEALRAQVRAGEGEPGAHPATARVRMSPTQAMKRGEAFVAQCAWCGLLACSGEGVVLAACPACGSLYWWGQKLPVGPFERGRANLAHRSPKGRTFIPADEGEASNA